jgi:polysaccharide biosynthesis/export protein
MLILFCWIAFAWSAAADDAGENGMRTMPATAEEGSGAVVISNSDYHIGPSDQLQIDIFHVEELSGVERVNSRGYIKMPLIGDVKVAGLTQEAAEDMIADLYAVEYLQDPQVNIDIVEYVSQQVTIIGSVERPGVFPLKGKTTLMQALAMAGGPAHLADEEGIVVFRANAEGLVTGYQVNLEQIQQGIKGDPEVIGNDKIVVPESGSAATIKGVTDTLRGFVGFKRN